MQSKLESLATSFPAVGLMGPRQSGKTTLVKHLFSDKPYVSLEDPDNRRFAIDDPRGFLSAHKNGAVFDEIQRAPHLFSYLQGIIDAKNIPGMFILTGSQNFLLMEKITQSLAGRIALLHLLPFSMQELNEVDRGFPEYEQFMFMGMYPRLYDQDIMPVDLYPNYVNTYVERDIRLLKNVHDLSAFHRFLKMCAFRTGQLLNLSSLADDCGISHNTAKSWLSLLETSFVVFLLRPHHRNFNKRLVKMPKIYFYDTGLACYLTDIREEKQLINHSLKGGLFESFILSELLKFRYNRGRRPDLYFWRDKAGHEIDCIIEKGTTLFPVEIKAGKTVTPDYFKNIKYWNKISGNNPEDSCVVYGGDTRQLLHGTTVLPWSDVCELCGQ